MAWGIVVSAGYFHASADVRAVGVVVSGLACGALAARRSAPWPVVAVTTAIAVALFALDPAIAPYALLVPAVALCAIAFNGTRTVRLAGGFGAAAFVVASEAANQHRPGIIASLQHVGMIALPILAAELHRTSRSYRDVLHERRLLLGKSREQEAQRCVQEERLRIARDLHDVVAHTLTTINVQAAVAGHLLDSRPEHARDALAVIEDASRDAIAELRTILGVLRDPTGESAPRTPTPGVDEVADLVEIACGAGLRARLKVSGERPDRLPEGVSLAAYRIVQESLTNAARHAVGTNVRVDLAFGPNELAIDVENSAPTVAAVAGTHGVGIVGMTERAEALGGRLRAAGHDTGFLVAARLPYRAGPG